MSHARHRLLDQDCTYIWQHLEEKIALPDLLGHLGVSESCLAWAFWDLLGTSPGKYIQFTKVKYAEQLLKIRELNVQEVADRLGFSSTFYLTASSGSIMGYPLPAIFANGTEGMPYRRSLEGKPYVLSGIRYGLQPLHAGIMPSKHIWGSVMGIDFSSEKWARIKESHARWWAGTLDRPL